MHMRDHTYKQLQMEVLLRRVWKMYFDNTHLPKGALTIHSLLSFDYPNVVHS